MAIVDPFAPKAAATPGIVDPFKPVAGGLTRPAPSSSAASAVADFAARQQQAAPPPQLTRSWGQAAGDVGRAFMSGAAGLVKTGGDLYGLASGNVDNLASELGQNAQEYWQEGQSDALKAQKQARSEAIDRADGVLAQAGTAVWETLKRPALLADVTAENAMTMLPAGAAGRGAAVLATKLGRPAASAARLGLAGAIGTGAVQQASDVSRAAYDSALTGTNWDSNPDFVQRVAAGENPEAVKHDMALATARVTFPAAAGISAASQAVPGGTMLERALVGGAARNTLARSGPLSRALAGARGALGEGVQEAVEEGGGQFSGNLARQQMLDPTASLAEGVGENAGIGFVGGMMLGGPAGLAHGPRHPDAKPGSLSDAVNVLDATAPAPSPHFIGDQAGNVADTRQQTQPPAEPATVTAEEITARAQKALDALNAKAMEGAITEQELRQREWLANNIGNPEALAAKRGVKLAQPEAPTAATTSEAEPAAPAIPWFNAETGELREATDEEVKDQFHRMFEAASQAGSGRAGTSASKGRAEEWGIDHARLKKLRNEAVAERKAGITPETRAQQQELGGDEDMSRLDEALGTAPQPEAPPAQETPRQRQAREDAAGVEQDEAALRDIGRTPEAQPSASEPAEAVQAEPAQESQAPAAPEPNSETDAERYARLVDLPYLLRSKDDDTFMAEYRQAQETAGEVAGARSPGQPTTRDAILAVPDSAFNGDLENSLQGVFDSEEYAGAPVLLVNRGFTSEEVEALQRAGLADTDGRMSVAQFGEWMAERSERLSGRRQKAPRPDRTAEIRAARIKRLRDREASGAISEGEREELGRLEGASLAPVAATADAPADAEEAATPGAAPKPTESAAPSGSAPPQPDTAQSSPAAAQDSPAVPASPTVDAKAQSRPEHTRPTTPPAEQPAAENAPLATGDAITITSGKHQGKAGTVFRAGKISIGVQFEDGTRASLSPKVVAKAAAVVNSSLTTEAGPSEAKPATTTEESSEVQGDPGSTAPAEFMHHGTRIYPTNIRTGDGVTQMWAVESKENTARRLRGERTRGGDTLARTPEEARRIADHEAKAAREREAREQMANEAAATERAAQAEGKADTLNGFTADMPPMQAARVKKVLGKLVRFGDGGIRTVREQVERLHANSDLTTETRDEPKIKPMSRTQFNRASNAEQHAHEKRMKAAGNKTVYLVGGSDLGKIAYDYARHLLDNPATNEDANGSDTRPGVETVRGMGEAAPRPADGVGEDRAARAGGEVAGPARSERDRALDALDAVRRKKPRSLNQVYGPNPTAAQAAQHAAAVREWNRAHGAASRAFKKAEAERLSAEAAARVEAAAAEAAHSQQQADTKPEKPDDTKLTAEEARKRLKWRAMGTKDGTTSHALFFDDGETSSGMRYGEVERYTGGKWEVDGGGRFESLTDAKREAVNLALARLQRDGYARADALEGRATPKPQQAATHAEPGQKPEPATAPVVAEALKTAAENTPRSIAQAKAWLLAKIDAAIEKAPEGAHGDGFTTFDVPGDGKFRILNAKDRLREFRKKVEKSPGFRKTSGKTPVPSTTRFAADHPAMVKPLSQAAAREAHGALSDADLRTAERDAVDAVKKLIQDFPAGEYRDLVDLNLAAAAVEAYQREMVRRGMRKQTYVDKANEAVDRVEEAAGEAAHSDANDLPEPSEAQKEAGNYAMGHVRLHGLDVSIENPRGSVRSGTDRDGETWSHEMSDHYGYIKRTEGADGEHVDVYIGPNPASEQVFIVDQVHQDSGAFDEHKVMLGFDSEAEAVRAYRANFDRGWKVGSVTAMDMEQFKAWLKDGAAKPATESPVTIEDFGEKIGGARKDTARKTGPKAAKSKDDRPAWARRYSIAPVVKSSNPAHEGRWFITDNRKKDWAGQPRTVGSRDGFATQKEAEDALAVVEVARNHVVRSDRDGKYGIWRRINDRKMVRVVPDLFDTRLAAMEHMAANAKAIIETNTTFGEADIPRPPSSERIGEARREGDIKDSAFKQVFGFRGVEFGNWNNQAERQELLNDAYDGLLDLAEVLGIPPRAISLNGELALAFGARGHGLSGARAHYELRKVVINLTKENGAGSLAHEWFHAIDHYFARKDGKAPSEWVVDKDGTRSLKVNDDAFVSAGTRGERSGMRAELREAFSVLMNTIARKGVEYVEDTANADKFVGIARAGVEREIESIRNHLARQLTYGKRHTAPATAEQLAEFDTVAERILSGEALEIRSISPGRTTRESNDALEAISAIMKKVRGTAGFNAERRGPLDTLRYRMQDYRQRLKLLKDAEQETTKTRAVPTDFKMEAVSLDQGRGGNYWTEPHELAARAFQGYVEDKIAERGGQSPFLNFGPENAAIPTPWGVAYPFPRGAERAAINAALDKLVGTLQTRETADGNVELFASDAAATPTVRNAPSAAALRGAIHDAVRTWGSNMPRVRVLATAAEYPAHLRERWERSDYARPLWRKSQGYNDTAGGTVYVVAGNVRSVQHGMQILAHEMVGHYGVDKIIDERIPGGWQTVVGSVARLRVDPSKASQKMQAVLREAERRYSTASPEVFAREVIAIAAEHGVRNSWVSQAIAAVRAWLRQHFPGLEFNSADMLALLTHSEAFLRESDPAVDAQRAAVGAMSFSFAGARAVTADLSKLDEARQREAIGRDSVPLRDGRVMGSPSDTHQATGWHKGVDGRWRWEIDDSGAKVRMGWLAAARTGGTTLDQVLDHRDLFGAYPHLADVKVVIQPGLKAYGSYDERTNTLTLRGGTAAYPASGPKSLRSLILHETQHAIQGIEGFARGGNIEGVKTMAEYQRVLASVNAKGLTDAELRAAYAVYHRLAGEVEARNTQRRAGMTAEQRQRFTPGMTQDVPRSNQIVRGTGALSASEDGIISKNSNNIEGLEIVAFEPSQIKSATENTGDFDADNANIQFSLSDPTAATEQIEEAIANPDGALFERAKAWLRGKGENLVPAALQGLQRRHLTELMEGHRALKTYGKQYDERVQQMEADRGQLIAGAADAAEHPDDMLKRGAATIADALEKFARPPGLAGWFGRRNPEYIALAKVMHSATIEGMDPSEEYQRLLMEDGKGNYMPWTAAAVKERLRAINVLIRSVPGGDKRDLIDRYKVLKGLDKREKAREAKWPGLLAAYQALSPEAKALYKQQRDWHSQMRDEVEKGLIARVEAIGRDMVANGADDMARRYMRQAIQRIRLQFETNRLEGVYFPLNRDGDFWLAIERAGEEGFKMFETAEAAHAAMKSLRKAGYTITASGRRDGNFRARNAPSGTFVGEIIKALKAARVPEKVQDEVYQVFLRSLPEMSMRKHSIHRKKTAGFDPEVLRGFSKTAYHGSYQLARLRHAHELGSILEAAEFAMRNYREASPGRDAPDILDVARGDALLGELKRRHDFIMSPEDNSTANVLNSVGFVYFLGATPAAALVNLTQNAQVTLPVLGAHHGWAKASRMLGAAVRDSLRTGGNIDRTFTTDEDRQAYKTLRARGDIDKTQSHTLAALSEGNTLKSSPAWSRAMEIVSFLFHKAEVVNREAAGMAAFRLARSRGDDFNAAVQYASDIINGTHFDYSAANRPRIMQGNAMRVATQFKSYSVGMTWMLGRNLHQAIRGESPEVRKASRQILAGVLGMTSLLAGVVGLPIINLVKVVAMAAHAAFGDDDEPWEFDVEFRQWLADHLGPEAAKWVADGPINQLTGAALSTRVSLSNLWFRDADRELEGAAAYYDMLEDMIGPIGGLTKNMFVGTQRISDGQVWRGVETMLPKFAKDAMKATRFATDGANTLRGDPIVDDISGPQALMQAIGFQPTVLFEQRKVTNALKNYEQNIQDRRTSLLNAFALATRAGEPTTDVMARIQAFNTKYPEIPISAAAIRQSMRARARYSSQAEAGVVVNRKLRELLGEMTGVGQ